MQGCWRQWTMKFARYAGLCAGICTLFLAVSPVPGEAAGQMGVAASLRGHAGAAGLSLIAGLIAVPVLVALLYLSQRRRWMEHEASHYLELSALRAKLDRAELFLGAESQIIVAWGGPGDDPDIEGNLRLAGGGSDPRRAAARTGGIVPPPRREFGRAPARIRGASDWRPCRAADQGRLGRSSRCRPPPRVAGGHDRATPRLAGTAQCCSIPGVGARRRRRIELGQCRLCPRCRSQGWRGRRLARHRAYRTSGA